MNRTRYLLLANTNNVQHNLNLYISTAPRYHRLRTHITSIQYLRIVNTCSSSSPNTNYADVGVSQKAAKQVLLSFFGTIASATFLLVGSSAAFNVVGKQLVKTNKKRTGRKCNLCDGLRFISCGTCKGRGALEWQPIREAEMERVCLCPTCSGTKMSKCLRCVGIGYL